MITTKIPVDWRDLENEVALILEQAGLKVEKTKIVKTARGQVEVDVFANETISRRNFSIIFECKHWSARVPQSVVHSFRTVVSDVGAHKGYIISKTGFQSGAIETTEYSNVELLTWEEFQMHFENSWMENYFSPRITKELDPLYSYLDPLFHSEKEISKQNMEIFHEMREKYTAFGLYCMSFAPYAKMLGNFNQGLPLSSWKNGEILFKDIPAEIKKAATYREFLEGSILFGKKIVEEFRVLFQQ